MATMDGFDHIQNWKLKHGSHPFPGKDGGTCINEAALVAAGFEYRPVRRVEDMPKCFSRPICRLAMAIERHGKRRQARAGTPTSISDTLFFSKIKSWLVSTKQTE